MIALACSINQNCSHNVQYPDSQSCAQIKGFDPSRFGSSLLETKQFSDLLFTRPNCRWQVFVKIANQENNWFQFLSFCLSPFACVISIPLSCLKCLPYRWRTLPSTAPLTSNLINSTVLSFLLPAAYQSSPPLPSTIQLFFPRKFSIWLHNLVDTKHKLIY